MSRSFHTTRRDLEESQAASFSSEEVRKDSIDRIKEELSKKRRSKRHVRYERNASFPEAAHTPIDLIPIEIENSSPFLHYPANADDLRDLMKCLPVGTVDGLAKIRLCLGESEQSSETDPWNLEPEKDPLLGRIGYETLPGVFGGRCRGVYVPFRQEIRLHGYVYASDHVDMSFWDVYLRLQSLMTFVHEVGHHFDFTFRVARGRWRGDNRDNLEIYAEQVQHQWRDKYVIPLLCEKYESQIRQLQSWILENVGVQIPFSLVAGDPRSTARNGHIKVNSFFSTESAFTTFVEKIHNGTGLSEARLGYAEDLHFAKEYTISLSIIDLLLRDKPDNIEALALKADIYVHLERYEEAIIVAEQVLTAEPEHVEALEAMADSYEGLKQWQKVIYWADKIISLPPELTEWKRDYALSAKANALIELGKRPEAENIIEHFEQGNRRTKRLAKTLREKLASLI
jgi:hypothetical protein